MSTICLMFSSYVDTCFVHLSLVLTWTFGAGCRRVVLICQMINSDGRVKYQTRLLISFNLSDLDAISSGYQELPKVSFSHLVWEAHPRLAHQTFVSFAAPVSQLFRFPKDSRVLCVNWWRPLGCLLFSPRSRAEGLRARHVLQWRW